MDTGKLVIILGAVGRSMLGLMFMCSTLRLLRLTGPASAGLTRRGLPFSRQFLYVAMVYKVIAGLLLVVGILVVPAAISLIGYTLVASWMMLDFWNKAGMERFVAENGWQANIGIVAGLLLVIVLRLMQHQS